MIRLTDFLDKADVKFPYLESSTAERCMALMWHLSWRHLLSLRRMRTSISVPLQKKKSVAFNTLLLCLWHYILPCIEVTLWLLPKPTKMIQKDFTNTPMSQEAKSWHCISSNPQLWAQSTQLGKQLVAKCRRPHTWKQLSLIGIWLDELPQWGATYRPAGLPTDQHLWPSLPSCPQSLFEGNQCDVSIWLPGWFSHLLQFNPRQQLSTMQPLAHFSPLPVISGGKQEDKK